MIRVETDRLEDAEAEVGEFVKFGPVGAPYRVVAKRVDPVAVLLVELDLEPVDVHDVPWHTSVRELGRRPRGVRVLS